MILQVKEDISFIVTKFILGWKGEKMGFFNTSSKVNY